MTGTPGASASTNAARTQGRRAGATQAVPSIASARESTGKKEGGKKANDEKGKGKRKQGDQSNPNSSGQMSLKDVIGNMMSGGFAGATVESVLYPLDTIKTRLQAQGSGSGLQARSTGFNGAIDFSLQQPMKKAFVRS